MQTSKTRILNQLQRRHGWRKSPYFVCEGERCCAEAMNHRPDWIEFGVCTEEVKATIASEDGPEFCVVSQAEFQSLSLTENPQGILLVLRKPVPQSFVAPPVSLVPVLDCLADPGNVGTILRTCWGMGFHTVVWTRGTVHPLNPKAIRAGMGAQFALNLHQIDTLDDLSSLAPEYPIWVTRPGAPISCIDDAFTATGFIVMGNEANGVGDVDGGRDVSIPMPGHAESLNVAQAATIVLYEVVRRTLIRDAALI